MKAMKSINEFKKYAVSKIDELISASGLKAKVDVKNTDIYGNGILVECIVIDAEYAVEMMCPVKDVYQKCKMTGDPDGLLKELVNRIIREAAFQKEADDFMNKAKADYGFARKYLIPQICNIKNNTEFLENHPHIVLGDMAVTADLYLEAKEFIATMSVAYSVIEHWDVTEKQLIEDALWAEMDDVYLMEMDSMDRVIKHQDAPVNLLTMERYSVVSGEEKEYLLGSKSNHHGARAILNKNVMKKVADFLDDDFYILPVSVHEVIIVPKKGCKNSIYEMEKRLKKINNALEDKEDILSNKVVEYTRTEGKVVAIN